MTPDEVKGIVDSETAFLQRRGGDGSDFDLRWFTPAVELTCAVTRPWRART
jgi:hypothetical protein